MFIPLVILAGALVAALLGWQIGGREGAGVVAGFLGGGGAAALGAARQRHLMQHRPKEVMLGLVEVLLLKLGLILAGALIFGLVEPAAARVAGRYFLVAFAATSLFVTIPATLHLVGRPSGSRARRHDTDVPEEMEPL